MSASASSLRSIRLSISMLVFLICGITPRVECSETGFCKGRRRVSALPCLHLSHHQQSPSVQLVLQQGSQGPLSKKEELFYRLSQGRPHLLVDMRIVNDEGNELPHDGKATGELQVRGPHVIKSYFRVRSSHFLPGSPPQNLNNELPHDGKATGELRVRGRHVISHTSA